MHPQQRSFNYMRLWRENRGLNLTDMTALTGLHKSTMSRMETGKVPYHRDVLEAYARVIGCQPGDLISRPPGVAEDLFRLLAHCDADELRHIAEMAKEVLEQRRKKKLETAGN